MVLEQNILREAIEVTSSLLSLSHSIRVFPAKWQAIQNRLNELISTLTAAGNCLSEESSEISKVVLPMMETLQECHGHARSCLELSYIGKLLMQSDLDVVLAKVDKHIQDLSGAVTMGNPERGHAIVVSRPVSGACVEDMEFYVRDLFTRLKIGDKEMKKQALVAINEVVVEDDKYVKIIMEVSEIIPALANLLDSDDSQIQEECTKSVHGIAGFEGTKNLLIRAGIIAPLIRVLESGNEGGKEGSAKCLMKMTADSDNAWSVSAHGGVSALLKICSTYAECGGELVGLACAVLKNVAGVEEIKRYIVEAEAIPILIKLVRSSDEASHISSMELLQTLALRDESVRRIVIEEGGISALNSVLRSKSCSSSTFRSPKVALATINSIFLTSISSINLLMNHGFIDQLLHFLRDGEVSIRELALKSVLQLCEASEEAKKSMGDAGFMSELITFLNAKSSDVREIAAEALYYMILVHRNRKLFIQGDANISFLVQSLDQEGGFSGNKKFLLCTLMEITSSNSGRKKIISSGYLKKIEKLAEADISDAKKIVRNLSTNRFRGMLNRFLNT